MSLFLIYFGTKIKYPRLLHHNIMFGPRYRELLSDIFQRGRLADDFSLYLHAPTRSDPMLAPPGCDTFYVLSPVPHLGKAGLTGKSEGPRYAEKVLGYLERHYMPDLKKHHRYSTNLYALGFQSRTQCSSRFRILVGAEVAAERLFPGAQPRPTYSWTLLCRSWNTSGGGNPRCCQFGEGNG